MFLGSRAIDRYYYSHLGTAKNCLTFESNSGQSWEIYTIYYIASNVTTLFSKGKVLDSPHKGRVQRNLCAPFIAIRCTED